MFSSYGDEKQIEQFDVLQDITVNNYVGAKSLEYNLTLIPEHYDLMIERLQESDREYIMNGIDHILSANHIEKIWTMIWKRWCHFEEICSKKKK